MDPLALIVARRSVRTRVGVGAAIVLVLVGLGIAVLVSAFGAHGSSRSIGASSGSPTPGSTGARSSTAGATIYLHILGAVSKPGLYLLSDGDRAIDLVAAAGGFTPTADQSGLNLARPLVDGEQVIVPNIGEGPESGAVPGTAASGGKVNINTADETMLETLPRVGPAMAKRIIDWRTKNGRFAALEDLMSVTGVGEKTFDSLKDLVTL